MTGHRALIVLTCAAAVAGCRSIYDPGGGVDAGPRDECILAFGFEGALEAAWTFDGDSPWEVDPSESYDGNRSLRSGRIGHSSESSAMLEVFNPLPEPATLSFAYRVSSESCCDHLSFLVDGSERDQWAGERDWDIATYSLDQGLHVLAWRYAKDGSVVGGDDGAWIDAVSIELGPSATCTPDAGPGPGRDAGPAQDAGPLPDRCYGLFEECPLRSFAPSDLRLHLEMSGNLEDSSGAMLEASYDVLPSFSFDAPRSELGGIATFSGEEYVGFPAPSLTYADARPMAIDFWVRSRDGGAIWEQPMESDSGVFGIYLSAAFGGLAVQPPSGELLLASGTPINDDLWHHVLLFASGTGEAALYVDGGLVAETSTFRSLDAPWSMDRTRLAYGEGFPVEPLLGSLDEVRVWAAR